MTDVATVLYIRPFDEERRLFARDRTFEDFFAEAIGQVGRLVALGYPGERVSPRGAMRSYQSDDEWREAFDRLASSASCAVASVRSSRNTVWELRRVRFLSMQERLFLFISPAANDAATGVGLGGGAVGRVLRRGLRFLGAYVSSDMEEFTRLLSFGAPPLSSEPVSSVDWESFAQTLESCGHTVGVGDPGPGSVLGFDRAGTVLLLTTGARTPEEFVAPVVRALAQTGQAGSST